MRLTSEAHRSLCGACGRPGDELFGTWRNYGSVTHDCSARVLLVSVRGHKWFCGPKGTAVLYVAPEHQKWVDPLVISHGYGLPDRLDPSVCRWSSLAYRTSIASGVCFRSDFPSGFYWPGLSDFTSWLALDEVLAFWDLEARLHWCPCFVVLVAT